MAATELTYRTRLPVSAAEAVAWHSRSGAFERLSPPWMDVRVAASHGTISPGDWKRLHLAWGPLGLDWLITHQELDSANGVVGFIDEQRSGPFDFWRHEHRFHDNADGASVLEDALSYALPFRDVGDWVAGVRVKTRVDETFEFRHRRTQMDLERHSAYGGPPLSILVSGASGLVGRQLVAFLRSGGHSVSCLVRRKPSGEDEIFWNPATGEIDAARLERMDAVVHLAGESIADGRWTEARKARILTSRIDGTGLLARTLAGLRFPPSVLVSASATGYYGDRGAETLNEQSTGGSGFLAGVCRAWEEATSPASDAGIRVVTPRFGVVLSAGGGLLKRVSPIFRFGLGGRLGSGWQYFSWIALDDLLGVLHHSIIDSSLRGPINAVSPNPVTNHDFTAAMGRVLGRPTVVPAPAAGLRVVFGSLADELLLASQRAEPVRLVESGFWFSFPSLDGALGHEFGKSAASTAQPELPVAPLENEVTGSRAVTDRQNAA